MMVVHIVMFKFNEENRSEHTVQAKAMLERLVEVVPSLKSMEVGVNFAQEERAMDMCIVTHFDDKAGLEAYAVHPEHQKVVAFLKEVCAFTKVVDYEK